MVIAVRFRSAHRTDSAVPVEFVDSTLDKFPCELNTNAFGTKRATRKGVPTCYGSIFVQRIAIASRIYWYENCASVVFKNKILPFY